MWLTEYVVTPLLHCSIILVKILCGQNHSYTATDQALQFGQQMTAAFFLAKNHSICECEFLAANDMLKTLIHGHPVVLVKGL